MKANKDQIEIRIIKVSELLKKYRKDAGYSSYEQFAIDNDLDRKQYWRAENGANLTLKSLFSILDKHNISAKEFFNNLSD